MIVSYTLDADDRITTVGGDWDKFAQENDGLDAMADRVIGRLLFDFIHGDEVRSLYRILINRVREHQKPAEFHFRCDAPTCKRDMELRLEPLSHGAVGIDSVLIDETEREPEISLLNRRADRTDEFIRICCICAKVKSMTGEWVDIEEEVNRRRLFVELTLPQLSHGICPDCYKAQCEKLGIVPAKY